MVKEWPCIMSAPMVCAILAGDKSQTRRLAWREPRDPASGKIADSYQRPTIWQKVEAGERLWVRETYSDDPASGPAYRASEPPATGRILKWQPSIYMPRSVCRIMLEVTATRMERLHDIPLDDVRREGCTVRQMWLFGAESKERQQIGARVFSALWEKLHGRASWDENPEVIVISFKRINVSAKEAA